MRDISEFIKNKGNARQKRRYELVAVKDEVLQYVFAGITRKTIWLYLRHTKQIECTYDTFLRFIRCQIKPKSKIEDQTQVETYSPPNQTTRNVNKMVSREKLEQIKKFKQE